MRWKHRIRIGKGNSMKVQLYLGYSVLLAFLAGLIGVFLFLGMRTLVMNQIGQSRLDVLKQVSERSNIVKNSVITISNLYRYDERVLDCLESDKRNFVEETSARRYLYDLKRTYDRVFHDVGMTYEIVILGNNGFQYFSYAQYDFEDLENQLWYRKSYDSEDGIVFVSSFLNKFGAPDEKEGYVFSAFRRVLDKDGKEAGVILVNVDESYLEALYNSGEYDSNMYIFDKMGNIVSSKDKNLIGKNYISVENFRNLYGLNRSCPIKKLGKTYLLSNYYDPQTGWVIVEEMPAYLILEPFNKMITMLVSLCLVFVVMGGFFAYAWSSRISKPILTLCSQMNQVRHGDFSVVSDISGCEEVNQLKECFNAMAAEISKLLESVKQKEIKKRQMEQDFLRLQINPHFLYNTLFSIQCMVEFGKNTQAVQMLAAYIDLLKRTLHVGRELIPLKEEFENTEKYLELQQIRYGNKIQYKCEMEKETEKLLVPALIIQPLVENAIFHGIEAKNEEGIIIVESSVEGEILNITVSDDGLGMSEERLDCLRKSLKSDENRTGRTIGIFNVLNRIRIYFGQEYGLTVDSMEGIGTTITIRLPLQRDLEGAEA